MSHYEERLEQDLNAIRDHMQTLSEVTRGALDNGLRSVFNQDRKLAFATILGDAWINVQARGIDALCHRFMARHLPSAGHLRYTSAVIRVALQLERLGDYAVIIAREGVQLSAAPSGETGRQVEQRAEQANRMLVEAIDAFNAGNDEKARATMSLGDSLEGTMDTVYADLMTASDPAQVKDLVALFVIFNNIKRVADQAKNICEETLFAVTGETKQAPVHRVLFLDEDNARMGQLARAIAEKSHPGVAHFESAGVAPAGAVDADLVSFLEDHGYDCSDARPSRFEPTLDAMSRYFVIVCLDGPFERYSRQLPFHTSVLEWDLGDWPHGLEGESLTTRLEEVYRETSVRVQDLVDTLIGDEIPT